jgi:microcystin-dependent protein
MPDIKLSIDDLPPATTVYNADVFVIDQLGSDGYSKKLTYQILKNTLGADAFVLRVGDTMTGALILNTSTPSLSLQAAPKAYVDTFLSKAGGTMTGNLILNTNAPANALQATSRAYVQNNFIPISGIGTGEQDTGMTGFLTLCAHPISAFHAATKFYVDNRSGDGSPVGSIVYFAASAAPVGWFQCNGAVLDKTIYVDLFNVIGYSYGGSGNQFLLPDLRGQFLRGWDNGRGVDAGRSFGSSQLDEFKAHNHTSTFIRDRSSGATGNAVLGDEDYYGLQNVNTNTVGGTETRPRNVALLPCIKYATNAAVNYLGLSAQALLNYVNSLSAQIPNPKSVAKAWVTFSGQTATAVISASYNVTSVTRTSVGDYTIAFASNMVDSLYGVFINDNYEGIGAINRFVVSQTTSNVRIKFKDTGVGGNLYDPTFAYVNVFGN